MSSLSNRRESPQRQHLLAQATRQALIKGARWAWGIQLMIAAFMWFHVQAMHDAHLVVEGALPWQLGIHVELLLLVLLLQPLLWYWLERWPLTRWRKAVFILALLWGCLWASVIYALLKTELPGRGTMEPAIAATLLLVGLISFYPMSQVLYGFCLPILVSLISQILINVVAFPWLFGSGMLILLILLETGRRMLTSWFVLAVDREYEQELMLKRLDAMAHQDPLTGIANRRHFDIASKEAIAQGARLNVPLTVILLDVDFFKPYNDHYGHQAGDECLILVAECLEESVREPGDLVARYGGEEFVVLLSETDCRGAIKVAERIRATLAARALPHAGSTVAPHLTLSQGIAQWQQGQTLIDLLERADSALYQVKEQGRNHHAVAP
ncbi:MAG: membrane-associated sensor domain-containing protein [Aeromonas molluscorum]